MWKHLPLALALFALAWFPAADADCFPLTEPANSVVGSNSWTSLCANVLGYSSVTTRTNTCPGGDESQLALLVSAASNFSLPCATAFMRYTCAYAHPPCGVASDALPPQALCDDLAVTSSVCVGHDQTILAVMKAGLMLNITRCTASSDPAYVFKNSTANPGATTLTYSDMAIPQCGTYTGSVCASVVNYPVYLQTGNPAQLTLAENTVNNAKFLFTAVPPSCKDDFFRELCIFAFPRCVNKASSVHVALKSVVFPQFPSKTFAQSVQSACGLNPRGTPWTYSVPQFINLNTVVPIQRNCTTNGTYYFPTTSTSIAQFPSDTGYVTPTGVTVEPNTAYGAGVAEVNCPYPTGVAYDGVATVLGSCAVRCPIPLYTRDDYIAVDGVMGTVSGLGLFLCSLMLATYFAFSRTRKKMYTIFFTADLWVVSFALFWPVAMNNPNNDYGKYQGMQCIDEVKLNHRGWCLFQAIAMQYCGFSACSWWCIQAIDLLLQILFNAGKWSDQRKFFLNLAYNLYGWGVPLILMLVTVGVDQLGNASLGIPYCFIKDENLSWGVFYGPIAVMIVVGFTCMIVTLAVIYRSSSVSGAHKRKGGYFIYIRPLLFILFFLVVWILIFVYRFKEHFNQDGYRDKISEWISCVLISKPAGLVSSCDMRPNPDKGLWYVLITVVGGVGIWGFMLYNTWENCVMWYHLLTCKAYNFSRTSAVSEDTEDKSVSRSGKLSRQGSKKNIKSSQSSANLMKSSTSGGTDETPGLRYGAAAPLSPSSSTTELAPDPRFSSASVPPTGNNDFTSASVPPTGYNNNNSNSANPPIIRAPSLDVADTI